MSAKYQAYAEYKHSGVEWLGGVMKYWQYTTTPSFLRALSRNLYASNGSPIKDFGDDVVGSVL